MWDGARWLGVRGFAFVADAVDATWDLLWETGKLLYRTNPLHAVYNPKDFSNALKELADGLVFTVTHPWELLGWSDIANRQPGRVPTIVSSLVGLRGVKGLKKPAVAKPPPAASPRLPQDISVNPKARAPKPLNRPTGRNALRNQAMQRRVADLQRQGARDIRIDQQQVNVNGERVGVNRPDLQYTLNGKRYYEEYDVPASNSGPAHKLRIEANDPNGEVILHTVP